MNTLNVSRNVSWAGIGLIALTGLIHLVEAPEYFEIVPYVGVLFVANAVGAALAAYGILRGRGWGWGLGLLVAGGAFVAYIVSRTVGLPGAGALVEEGLFETVGLISLLIEGGFVILGASALSGNTSASRAPKRASEDVAGR